MGVDCGVVVVSSGPTVEDDELGVEEAGDSKLLRIQYPGTNEK